MPLRPNQKRAKNIILILWICIFVNFITIFLDFQDYFSYKNSLKNSGIVFDLDNNWQYWIYLFRLLLNIVTAIFFIMWFRRAYFNLHLINTKNLAFSEGWAAGSWFLPPFTLLTRPYYIMKEIWLQTQLNIKEKKDIKKTILIEWWWAFWISYNLLDFFISLYLGNGNRPEKRFTGILLSFTREIMLIPASILVIILIRNISKFETELFTSRENLNPEEIL